MSPKTGRPPKKETDKKNVRLQIRLTAEQSNEIKALSEKLNLSKTDTIIKAVRFLAKKK